MISGVILAGGLAQRMGGGDKPLLTLNGRPLLSHVVDCLRPQVDRLAISANGDSARFASWDAPVIADPIPGAEGPLAGILAGLQWATGDIITSPGDTPFIPSDLAAKLRAVFEREQVDVVMASHAGNLQPAIALWSARLTDDLERTLKDTDLRSVRAYAHTRKWAVAHFDDGPDPFFNINTPDDLAAAEARFTSTT
jgi:molybdopterin-guanine dinucleotide biosynthesis protein A